MSLRTTKAAISRAGTPSYPLRLNCFGFNENATARYVKSLSRERTFTVSFSSAPEDPLAVDLYLAPSSAVREGKLPESLLRRESPPLFLSGPSADLRSAFLIGCADFLKEPWSTDELIARAERALRYYRFPGIPEAVRFTGSALYCGIGQIPLTPHETLILRTLLRFNGEPVSRETLFILTGKNAEAGSGRGKPGRSADVHIAALRRKLSPLFPEGTVPIGTARGLGYHIEPGRAGRAPDSP